MSKENEDGSNIGDFGALINALGGGGNTGNIFPEDDAIDLRNGARYIPSEVTDARRAGKKVIFELDKHHWLMPDGKYVE